MIVRYMFRFSLEQAKVFSMNERVGMAIRRTREVRGVSLRALATALGLSPATVSAVERGLTPLTLDRVEQIAQVLDVPAATLLRGEAPPLAGAASASPRPATARDSGSWRDYDDLELGPVLEAATELFVRQGYHATSMREIATVSGVSVAGIYHHYPSKERILVELLNVTMAELTWRLEAAGRQGRDPLDSFAQMVEALAHFHVVRSDLAFLGASEMRAFSFAERARITERRDGIQHALDRQAERCADAGLAGGDLRTATRAIATMCTSLPSWFRLDGPMSATDVARRYAQYALAMIRPPVR